MTRPLLPTKNPLWRAALYIRLSKDDGDKSESCSITSQREILKEYLKLHPDIELFDIYVDDGWSGTNFDRPGFCRMMEDIYAGNVNCVIVKDLSRFGRNYAMAGYYLDTIFVRYHVRFIALNNGLDTASDKMNAATHCISVGITNVMNESFAAATSVNVRAALNNSRRQGKFIGSFAAYGYLKDPSDHHKLIVDEEAAEVVRLIFSKFVNGMSIIGIAKELNAMGIPNPSAYKRKKGLNCNRRYSGTYSDLWPDSSVRRILKNELYIGNMVQGKNTTMSYKLKQCRAIPKEDWIVVENTHRPIIDRDTFYRAQDMFERHVRQSPTNHEAGLFSGLMFCFECRHTMNKKTNVHPYGTYEYYRCVSTRKLRQTSCSSNTIRIDKLEKAVLVTLQQLIRAFVDTDLIQKMVDEKKRHDVKAPFQQTIEAFRAEEKQYEVMQIELYPDLKRGLLTEKQYVAQRDFIAGKLEQIKEAVSKLSADQHQLIGESGRGIEDIDYLLKHKSIRQLTRPLLLELVDKIEVSENNQIKICFKFQDVICASDEAVAV